MKKSVVFRLMSLLVVNYFFGCSIAFGAAEQWVSRLVPAAGNHIEIEITPQVRQRVDRLRKAIGTSFPVVNRKFFKLSEDASARVFADHIISFLHLLVQQDAYMKIHSAISQNDRELFELRLWLSRQKKWYYAKLLSDRHLSRSEKQYIENSIDALKVQKMLLNQICVQQYFATSKESLACFLSNYKAINSAEYYDDMQPLLERFIVSTNYEIYFYGCRLAYHRNLAILDKRHDYWTELEKVYGQALFTLLDQRYRCGSYDIAFLEPLCKIAECDQQITLKAYQCVMQNCNREYLEKCENEGRLLLDQVVQRYESDRAYFNQLYTLFFDVLKKVVTDNNVQEIVLPAETLHDASFQLLNIDVLHMPDLPVFRVEKTYSQQEVAESYLDKDLLAMHPGSKKRNKKRNKAIKDRLPTELLPVAGVEARVSDAKVFPAKDRSSDGVATTAGDESLTGEDQLLASTQVDAVVPPLAMSIENKIAEFPVSIDQSETASPLAIRDKWIAAIAPYTDGAIVSETNECVTIDDHANHVRLYLYGTDNAQCRYPRYTKELNYLPNVASWFSNVKTALAEQGYHEAYVDSKKYFSSAKQLSEIVLVHRFSKLVDQFVPTRGVVNFVASRRFPGQVDFQIAIPGSYEDMHNQVSKTCIFVYLINPTTRKCFHRNIQECSMMDLMEQFGKGFFNVHEFPALH